LTIKTQEGKLMIFAILFSRYPWSKTIFFVVIFAVIALSMLGPYIEWARNIRVMAGLSMVALFVAVLVLGDITLYFRNSRIRKIGVKAGARIISVSETGWFSRYGRRTVLKLVLEVQAADLPAYQAELIGYFSNLELVKLQPGETVMVKYDPAKPKSVVLDNAEELAVGTPAHAAPTAGADTAITQMLLKYNAINAELLSTGLEADATILQSWDMGIQVNGDNPVMRFLLEVQPYTKPDFTSEAQGPVKRSSLHKYQIGQKVRVRYDADDQTKVMIERAL
jgi:hypothetical protein